MVNRTKQPEGCIGISEKCVFAWKSLSSRYRKQLKWGFFSNCSFTSTLLDLSKLAFERMLQEGLSVKVVLKYSQLTVSSAVRMFFLAVFQRTPWGITAQLKCTVFYGPISMKEKCGTPLLGLAKSIYHIFSSYFRRRSAKILR